MIYMDNNATTRVDPAVLAAMWPYLEGHFANPSSPYGSGRHVARAIWESREKVAGLVGAGPEQVVFTSGGTEANNTALCGVLRALRSADASRRRVLISAVEHASVRVPAWVLAEEQGCELVEVPVDGEGGLCREVLAAELDERTALVSIMMANNETGVVYPVREIAEQAHACGAVMHCDAVQAVGKIAVDVAELGVDLLSASAHKLHGPKGIGILVVAACPGFNPLLRGGGQESGRRAGTENVASIIGFGEAAERVVIEEPGGRVGQLRDRLEQGLVAGFSGCRVNGAGTPRVPQTTNLVFPGIEAEALIALLDLDGICCSTGSACTAGSPEPSHVLAAMGLDAASLGASVRFGLSRFTTDAEVDSVVDAVLRHVSRLR